VHGGHDVQLGQALMRDFFKRQRLWDYAGNLAIIFEHGIGKDTHQSNLSAAVNQSKTATDERGAEGARAFGVGFFDTLARSAKNAETMRVCRIHKLSLSLLLLSILSLNIAEIFSLILAVKSISNFANFFFSENR
jgi:hypothetical protein